MTTMTATALAKNLRTVLDRLEFMGEEIVITRNDHRIAKIIPGAPHLTALEAMSDLYRTLSDEAARDWLADSRLPQTVAQEKRDPWAS